METYIGISGVRADYETRNGIPGYRVTRMDKTVDWIERDQFNSQFRIPKTTTILGSNFNPNMLSVTQHKLVEDYNYMAGKVHELKMLINETVTESNNVTEDDIKRFTAQKAALQLYMTMLIERIDQFLINR